MISSGDSGGTTMFTPTDRRIGLWSARLLILLLVVYVFTGSLWVFREATPAGMAALAPEDPYLAILETLIVLCGPLEIALFAAIYAYAPPDRKTFALSALIFVSLLAVITCSLHFLLLTIGRQSGYAAIPGPGPFYPWPTVLFGLDLFAWDVFQGLGLVFAAPVFRGDKLHRAIRMAMFISGALCLVGVSGPASGDLRFQLLAVVGYVAGLFVVCVLLAILFTRPVARTFSLQGKG